MGQQIQGCIIGRNHGQPKGTRGGHEFFKHVISVQEIAAMNKLLVGSWNESK